MSKALVQGFGSIGSRHARLLKEFYDEVHIVSRRDLDISFPCHSSLKKALSEKPDLVVIANETHLHHDSLCSLKQLNFSGKILIEKPIFKNKPNLNHNMNDKIFVAYNLRFHPIIQKLKKQLQSERILSAQVYVGQHLETWRPLSNYRTCYSASAEKGGGVLRDLSHEIDYLFYFFGPPLSLSAKGGHFSQLESNSDDLYQISFEFANSLVIQLEINCLDRNPKRTLNLVGEHFCYEANLSKSELLINGKLSTFSNEVDLTYINQIEALYNQDDSILCTAQEGLVVLKAIELAELSSQKNGEWLEFK